MPAYLDGCCPAWENGSVSFPGLATRGKRLRGVGVPSTYDHGPMKILHTADWHLGDRLGRIDRTEDLRRAVERVARYCGEHQVDVLLVAGDLFSELARPD